MMLTAARKETTGTPTTLRPMDVLVADDHPLYRRGVVKALTDRPGDFTVLAEACDGERALALIEQLEPHIALLDMRMPQMNGIEVCARLRERDVPLGTRPVLLSAFDEPELVADAIAAGAAGYLDKEVSHQELCEALLRVGAGGVAYTHKTAEGVARRFTQVFG